MPSLESRDRKQTALWWYKTGVDNYGQPIIEDPVEIKVRWENKRDESLNKQGEPVAIDATVQLGQRVYPGDLMWLGTLDDWNNGGSTATNNEILQVDSYNEVPDIKGRNAVKVAMLTLFKGQLPS